MDEPKKRVIDPDSQPDDRLDMALRPRLLSDLIGQEGVKENLVILIDAARQRSDPLDQVLFYGPPGLWKTTLAHVLANEMGVNIKITSGPAIERAGDLAAILTNLRAGNWANVPYIEPPAMAKKEFYRETRKDIFGTKQVARERETYVKPDLFDDWSMVRMGRELDEICQIMRAKGDFRMGISSPKRYLWADDDSCLEGAFWYMADPTTGMARTNSPPNCTGRC